MVKKEEYNVYIGRSSSDTKNKNSALQVYTASAIIVYKGGRVTTYLFQTKCLKWAV